jgi:Ser/Thr protein kinase RdoA (MazF antagonist)
VDWRFLLPDPELHRVAYLGPDSELRQGLESFSSSLTVLGQREASQIAGKQHYDVVALRDPSAAALRLAAELLRPGGSLYAEIRRGLARPSAAGAIATLERAGMQEVRSYWHWPDFSRCAEIVPLQTRSLLLHALSRRRSGGIARAKAQLAGWLARRGWMARLVPCYSVVAQRPERTTTEPTSPRMGGVRFGNPGCRPADLAVSFLETHGARLPLEDLGLEGPLASMLVTPRFRASGHVVSLILGKGDSEPRLVAKMPRLRCTQGHLAREAANLRAVGRAGGRVGSVPKMLAFEPFGDGPLLLETALSGRPLDRAVVRRDPDTWCAAALAWMEELSLDEPGSARLEQGWQERLIEAPLRRLARSLPLSRQESRALDRTRSLGQSLLELGLPSVVEHGDLSHPNVLRLGPRRIGVLDWELAEPRGLPACDLFFFLSYVAFARDGAETSGECVKAFDRAFFGSSAWSSPWVADYAERFGLPHQSLTPLFVLCWARYVARLALRLEDPSKPSQPFSQETADWLRSNRYYRLWWHSLDHLERVEWSGPARPSPRGVGSR